MTKINEIRKLRTSSLSLANPIRGNHDSEHPRTPYPFDASTWTSNNPLACSEVKPAGPSLKRRKLENKEFVDGASMNTNPSTDAEYSNTNVHYNISSAELITASKSIIDQVNWSEVVLDVVGREKPVIYRNAFEKILRLHIKELLNQGTTSERKKIQSQEEDQVKGTHVTPSELSAISSGTEERSSNAEEHGDDKIFVEIVSADSGSEDYDDGGDEDAEDVEDGTEDAYEDESDEEDRISVTE